MTDQPTSTDEPLLSPLEARIIGSLMEKQRTTPEQYPLTLNALVTACNQKTARDPVMKLTPGEVGHAVGILRERGLVHESFTGRTQRYDHKLAGTFMLDRRQQGLLCALMLRGPQTPGELRTNAARLADFEAMNAVQATLHELEQHQPPLVRELPRQPGMREQRYSHLLSGEPRVEQPRAPMATASNASPVEPALIERIEVLEQAVAALREELDQLKDAQD